GNRASRGGGACTLAANDWAEAVVSGTCELAPPRERLGGPRVGAPECCSHAVAEVPVALAFGRVRKRRLAADTRIPRDRFVANAMADSEHAPMSEAVVGTATGQLAIASNAGS